MIYWQMQIKFEFNSGEYPIGNHGVVIDCKVTGLGISLHL